MNKMEKPDKYEKAVNPCSKDIAETARILAHSGEPVIVLVDISRDALKQGKKPEITGLLSKYGTVVDNPVWSRLIAIKPYSFDSLKALEDDYYDDKLPGVRALELDRKEVVYHGQTLDSYIP